MIIDLTSLRDLPRDVVYRSYSGTAEEIEVIANRYQEGYRIVYGPNRVLLYVMEPK